MNRFTVEETNLLSIYHEGSKAQLIENMTAALPYQSYIAHLSMRKLRDESGNTYYGIDEDLRERLQAKLMRAVLSFKTEK